MEALDVEEGRIWAPEGGLHLLSSIAGLLPPETPPLTTPAARPAGPHLLEFRAEASRCDGGGVEFSSKRLRRPRTMSPVIQDTVR